MRKQSMIETVGDKYSVFPAERTRRNTIGAGPNGVSQPRPISAIGSAASGRVARSVSVIGTRPVSSLVAAPRSPVDSGKVEKICFPKV